MLSPQQIDTIKSANQSGGVNPNQDMNQQQYQQWVSSPSGQTTKPTITPIAKPSGMAMPGLNDIEDASKNIIGDPLGDAAGQFTSGLKQFQKGSTNSKDVGTGAYDMLSGAGQAVAGGLNFAFSPFTAIMNGLGKIPTGKNQNLGEFINQNIVTPVANKISDNPTLQKIADKYPGLQQDIPNLLTIVTPLILSQLGESHNDVNAANANETTLHDQNATVAQQIENSQLLNTGDKVLSQDQLTGIHGDEQAISQYKNTPPPNIGTTPRTIGDVMSEFMRNPIKSTNEATGAGNAINSIKDTVTGLPKAVEGTMQGFEKGVETGVGKLVGKPIPVPVQNVLKETPRAQFDEYATIAKKASENYKNPTPLEHAGERAQTALDTIQRKLDNIGKQKSSVLSRAQVGDKPVGNIAVKFRQNLQNYLGTKTAVEGDTKLINDISNEAKKLGPNPSATSVDKFIDFVQDRIYTGNKDLTVPVTDSTTAALRKFTGQLNNDLKAKLPSSYSTLNDQYSTMVDTRNELNSKLGKEGEKGGALMKRVFSPSDANTKKLFADVKDLTGVDLINEATLARYVMETTGDSRQSSMLQQLNLPAPTKTGVLNWAWDKATSFANTPDAQLERARELTK